MWFKQQYEARVGARPVVDYGSQILISRQAYVTWPDSVLKRQNVIKCQQLAGLVARPLLQMRETPDTIPQEVFSVTEADVWFAVCFSVRCAVWLLPRSPPYTCETFGVRWEDVKFTAKEEDSDDEVIEFLSIPNFVNWMLHVQRITGLEKTWACKLLNMWSYSPAN